MSCNNLLSNNFMASKGEKKCKQIIIMTQMRNDQEKLGKSFPQ